MPHERPRACFLQCRSLHHTCLHHTCLRQNAAYTEHQHSHAAMMPDVMPMPPDYSISVPFMVQQLLVYRSWQQRTARRGSRPCVQPWLANLSYFHKRFLPCKPAHRSCSHDHELFFFTPACLSCSAPVNARIGQHVWLLARQA